jgi:hypothetical protein
MADLVTLALPVRGASNQSTFLNTPPETCPAARIRNVVVRTPPGDRPQIGTRPGTRRTINTFLGGPVQALRSVSRRAQGRGFIVPPADPLSGYVPCRVITGGISIESGTLLGNVFALDSVPSMMWQGQDQTASFGQADRPVIAAASIGTGAATRVYTACNFTDASGNRTARITSRNGLGLVQWAVTINAPGKDASVNTITASSLYVFCATLCGVVVLRRDTGAQVQIYTCNGHSLFVQRVRVHTDASGREMATIAFDGSNIGATLVSGVVVSPGQWARCFRSGVMRCTVEMTDPASPTPLVQVQLGQPLPTANIYHESNHGYVRISEVNPYAPRGCFVTDLDVAPDGSFVLTTTNTGWGPRSTAGTGYAAPDLTAVPRQSVWSFDASGRLRWIADRDTMAPVGLGGFLNDCLAPTLQAVAIDADGHAVVAGRLNDAGFSVYAMDGASGGERWRASLLGSGQSIREGCVGLDPTDGHLWVSGDRSTAWGGGGANAHLWKLDRGTGAVLASFDLAEAVSASALTITKDGTVVYGTGWVS